jgi:antagonist of KipI
MSLVVVHPGPCSLIVDGGRPHTRHRGIALGGAADRAAWMIGNSLIGNSPTATALEITLAGPTLRADANVGLCVVGAPFR